MLRSDRAKQILPLILSGILAIILIVMFYQARVSDEQRAAELHAISEQERQAAKTRRQTVVSSAETIQAVIDENFPGIICWGDEFTAGNDDGSYPNVLYDTIHKNLLQDMNDEIAELYYISGLQELELPIVNNGVRGERFMTIATRTGAEPLLLGEDTTFPSINQVVDIRFVNSAGSGIQFENQSDIKMGTLTIDGIKGTMYAASQTHDSSRYTYYSFRRTSQGEPREIAAGTEIQMEGAELYRDYVIILFFGNNDFNNVQSYINVHEAILNHQKNQKYIIVSRTDENSRMDQAMSGAFEDHYVRIDPDPLEEMDWDVLGTRIYETMYELGYFTQVERAVKTAERQLN